jgi:hypothetical protein
MPGSAPVGLSCQQSENIVITPMCPEEAGAEGQNLNSAPHTLWPWLTLEGLSPPTPKSLPQTPAQLTSQGSSCSSTTYQLCILGEFLTSQNLFPHL